MLIFQFSANIDHENPVEITKCVKNTRAFFGKIYFVSSFY